MLYQVSKAPLPILRIQEYTCCPQLAEAAQLHRSQQEYCMHVGKVVQAGQQQTEASFRPPRIFICVSASHFFVSDKLVHVYMSALHVYSSNITMDSRENQNSSSICRCSASQNVFELSKESTEGRNVIEILKSRGLVQVVLSSLRCTPYRFANPVVIAIDGAQLWGREIIELCREADTD